MENVTAAVGNVPELGEEAATGPSSTSLFAAQLLSKDREISARTALLQEREQELARAKERLLSSSTDVSDLKARMAQKDAELQQLRACDASELQARMAQKDAELQQLRDKLAASESEALHLREMVSEVIECEVIESATAARSWSCVSVSGGGRASSSRLH